MFLLTKDEFARLRSQIVISKATRGGQRYPPMAFTEHGIAMLSSVLRGERAIQVKHCDHESLYSFAANGTRPREAFAEACRAGKKV